MKSYIGYRFYDGDYGGKNNVWEIIEEYTLQGVECFGCKVISGNGNAGRCVKKDIDYFSEGNKWRFVLIQPKKFDI